MLPACPPRWRHASVDRSIMATVWSIGDNDAPPIVADAVDSGLLQKVGEGEKVKMAYILHDIEGGG